MTPCKTICVKCKHYNGVPASATWYDHYCLAPEVKRIEEQDPVTGAVGCAAKNSLGDIYFTDDAHPYCRDINKGNCEYYDGKNT